MELTFYTVEDLRTYWNPPQDGAGNLVRYSGFDDALAGYRIMSKDKRKALGVARGSQILELVRCLPVFPEDRSGEDVLVSDLLLLPAWRGNQELIRLAEQCVSALGIRYCLEDRWLLPAPDPAPPPAYLTDKYLWPDAPGEAVSAVRWIYVASVGWISPTEFERRYPAGENHVAHYPLILRYKADGLTEGGSFAPLEVTPWEYKRLQTRTKNRIRENKKQEADIPW